ncbi:lysozyme [Paraburkholderia phosphatilytica]|uniref:lysozyme n=1 Tax=Paraburkholderia phosphatilytica TaxID=2282883 RepID=UPI000E54E4AC|nr:lysozyme [Paraburkholderia phosphatilytica]
MMQVSENGVALTKASEGLYLIAYPDPASELGKALQSAGLWQGVLSGKAIPVAMAHLDGAPWTGGWGHTGPDVTPRMVITLAQAEAWIVADLRKAAFVVNKYVVATINQNQFDALSDFVFNEGAGNFISSTLLRMLNAGNYGDAATQFDRWDLAGGHVMAGLKTRRTEEKALFMKPASTPH